jgi:O-antigen/teichoic acid export membrane protein
MALKDFKSLTKDTLIYGIGNASDRIIRFVLLPLYSAYLPIASYGIRSLTIPFYEILKIIILLSIEQAVIADYYKAKTPEERRTVISTGFTFSLITSLLIGGLTYIFAAPLAVIMGFDFPDAVPILRLFAVFTALAPPGFVFLSFLRCEKRSVQYTIFTVVKALVKVGLMIIVLVALKKDLIGLYQVDAAMAIVFFVPVVVLIYIYTRGIKFSFVSLRSMFRYSLPLVPNMAFFWVRTMLDRWIIKSILGEAAVGVFGFAVNIANVVSFLLVGSINLAWIPYAFSIKDKPELPKIIARVFTYMLFIGGWALVALGGSAQELLQVIAKKPEYWASAPLIPILLVGMCLMGAFNIVGTPCQVKRKTVYFTITSIAGAAIVVTMNLLLLPKIELFASALAWVASYGVMLILMLSFSRKLMKIPYETKRILLISILAPAITAGLFFWNPASFSHLVTLLIKIGGGSMVYLGGLMLFGFLLPSERDFILNLLRRSKR